MMLGWCKSGAGGNMVVTDYRPGLELNGHHRTLRQSEQIEKEESASPYWTRLQKAGHKGASRNSEGLCLVRFCSSGVGDDAGLVQSAKGEGGGGGLGNKLATLHTGQDQNRAVTIGLHVSLNR